MQIKIYDIKGKIVKKEENKIEKEIASLEK